MKIKITLIIFAVSLTLGACKGKNRVTDGGQSGPAPSGNSPMTTGVSGTISTGPTAAPAGLIPSFAPYQATVTVLDASDQFVMTFRSGADGRYDLSLEPGMYKLMPEPPPANAAFPVASPVVLRLGEGERPTVNILFDSGIR